MIEKNNVALRSADKKLYHALVFSLSTEGRNEILKNNEQDPKEGFTAKIKASHPLHPNDPNKDLRIFEGHHLQQFIISITPNKPDPEYQNDKENVKPKPTRENYIELISSKNALDKLHEMPRHSMSDEAAKSFFDALAILFDTSDFQVLLSFFEYCHTKYLPLRIFEGDRDKLDDTIDGMRAYIPFYEKLDSEGKNAYEIEQLWKQLQESSRSSIKPHGLLVGHNDPRLVTFHGNEIIGREDNINEVISFLEGEQTNMYLYGTAGVGKSEICKVAIKQWLGIDNTAQVFYIKVPDGADEKRLLVLLAEAVGLDSEKAENLRTLHDLKSHLRPALYYLDNLESVAETRGGAEIIRDFSSIPKVRVLASSRIKLDGALNNSLQIETMDTESGKKLFSDSWRGIGELDEKALHNFVESYLGNHALSIHLIASASRNRSLEEIISLWSEKGVALASLQKSKKRADRYTNLDVSFSLTRDFLSSEEGALELWQFLALFDDGIDEQTLNCWEYNSGFKEAMSILEEYCIAQKHQDTYKILPPVSRYALDNVKSHKGFNWINSRKYSYAYFLLISFNSKFAPSTVYSDVSERLCAEQAQAIAKLFATDVTSGYLCIEHSSLLHLRLRNVYEAYISLTSAIYKITAKLFDDSVSYKMLAQNEIRKGNYQAAQRFSSKSVNLSAESGLDSIEYADTITISGIIDLYFGDTEGGKHKLSQALSIYDSHKAGRGLCTAQLSLSVVQYQANDTEQAEVGFRKAARIAEDMGDTQTLAAAYEKLAVLLIRKKELENARNYLNEAVVLLKPANRLSILGNIYLTYGKLEESCSDVDKALEWYCLAKNCFQDIKDIEGQKTALNYEATLSFSEAIHQIKGEGKYPQGKQRRITPELINKASTYAEAALMSFVISDNKDKSNRVRILLGNIYEALGNSRRAAEIMCEALDFYLETDLEKGNAYCFLNFVDLIINHRLKDFYEVARGFIATMIERNYHPPDPFGITVNICLTWRLRFLVSTVSREQVEEFFADIYNFIKLNEADDSDLLFQYLHLTVFECLNEDESEFAIFLQKQEYLQSEIIEPPRDFKLDWLRLWITTFSSELQSG